MNWKTVLTLLELYSSWEAWRETFFQKLITYHLPPTSSLLVSKDLSSLTVIVTGSTNGLGFHVAKELAMAGAHVVMACRNVILAEQIASSWREEICNNEKHVNIDVMELDLSSFASVRKFADEWDKLDVALDLLINNAGILQVEDVQKFTGDGIEQHIQVNHAAPALLTILMLPSLLKAPSSRIINVNSVGHLVGVVEPQYWNSRAKEENYVSMRAYGSSKLAQIMFLKVLANKLLDLNKTSIQCIAVHPGTVCSNLNSLLRKKHYFMFDADQGARSALYCATSDTVADNLVKGFAYYSVSCKPGKISSKSEDMDACLDVWQKTLELLDIGNDCLSPIFDNVLI
ncbi:NADP-retinol dehydrogenase [Ranunculus cassubicifolius]